MGISPQDCEQLLGRCASINLRKASRLVTQNYNEAFKPTGLRCTQIAILVAVGTGKSTSLNELSDILVMDISTLSRTLQPLQRAGYLRVQAGQGKKKNVLLTEKGWAKLEEAQPYWMKVQEQYVQTIGQPSWQSLLTLLNNTVDRFRFAA